MTSCCLTSFFLAAAHEHKVCVAFLKYQKLTCRQSLIPESCGQSEQSIWILAFGLAKAVHCINPSPSSVLLVSSHSPSLTSLRPKPHSWPNMAWSHQSEASEYLVEALRYFSDATAMRVEKKKPVLPFTVPGWRRHLAGGWEKSDVTKDLWGKSCLFLVWSEATGPGLHSQVPEQNRRNLSGLNKTQNHRLQICMKRGLDSS